MKLQINARGGWKDLCELEPEQLRAVQEAVLVLAQALAIGGRVDEGSVYSPSWRITANVARSPKVVAHLDPAKGLKWRRR